MIRNFRGRALWAKSVYLPAHPVFSGFLSHVEQQGLHPPGIRVRFERAQESNCISLGDVALSSNFNPVVRPPIGEKPRNHEMKKKTGILALKTVSF